MKRRYTDEQLIEAIQSSTSIRQVLAKLGLVEAGGNYSIVKRKIQSLDLCIAHFTGKGWKKGNSKPVISPRSLSEILQKGTYIQSYKLKNRLLQKD